MTNLPGVDEFTIGDTEVVVYAAEGPASPLEIQLVINVDGPNPRGVEAHITVAEARRYAEAILAVCDLVAESDADKLDGVA